MTAPDPARPTERDYAPASPATLAPEVAAGNLRFMEAFRTRDDHGVTACYTSDAQLLPAGSDVVSGADAIRAYWRAAMTAGIADVRLETVEVESRADLAVEVGRYALLGADAGTIDHGKYLVVWRREGGQLRLHRDIWTTSVVARRP